MERRRNEYPRRDVQFYSLYLARRRRRRSRQGEKKALDKKKRNGKQTWN